MAGAGGHHLALLGPPGSGTVALAHRLPGLLPDVEEPTAAQIDATYRAAGLLPDDVLGLVRPPWQAPHHTSGLAALTGSLLRPGAVALAHGGVLFLDEAGELPDRAIQALREPVEHGRVVVVGDGRRVEYPTRFQLVLASRGCPNTGRHTDGRCGCPARVRRDYLRRLDPLLGLVDLQVALPGPVPADSDGPPGESTGVVGARVAQARAAAATRWTRHGFTTNAQAGAAALRTDLAGPWGTQAAALLGRPDAARLSFADAIRVLAVAWTIDEFAGRVTPTEIRDAVAAVVAADPQALTQVMIVGGNERNLDRGFRNQIALVNAATEALSEAGLVEKVSVHLIAMPPHDLGLIDELVQVPNVHAGFNLEVWDSERFTEIAPGKTADYGQAAIRTALNRLRDAIGPYRAHSILIAGLEPAGSTLEGAQKLAADGISPIINAYHSDRHSSLGLTIRPTYRQLAEVAVGLQSLHDTYPIQPYWKGCGRNALDFEASHGMFRGTPPDFN